MAQLTLKSLAEMLNLSTSTISRALRDSHQIGIQTKEKVLALARDLNYFPNPHASSLRNNRTKTVAVVVPSINNSFFAQAVNGIAKFLNERSYHTLIYISDDDSNKEIDILSRLLNGRVDGVIVSVANTSNVTKHLLNLQRKSIPVVLFDRVSEKISTAKIVSNDFESSYTATKHLISQGARKIVFLSTGRNLSTSKKRKEGYVKALKDSDISFKKCLNLNCGLNDEGNLLQIKKLMESNKRPDGILTTDEHLAFYFYNVCGHLKISIPHDVKIISFSSLEIASLLTPALSTISQPAFEMGIEAAMILFNFLRFRNNKVLNKTISLKSSLIIRASSDN